MSLATITEKIWRALKPPPPPSPPPPRAQLIELQDHLQSSCGGGVIGCPCGGFLTPIVNRRPFGLEVPAIVCVACRHISPLDEPGLFADYDNASSSSATVH